MCTRIEVELLRSDLTEEQREALNGEKSTHLGAAIIQRRAVRDFIDQFVKKEKGKDLSKTISTLGKDFDLLKERPKIQINLAN